MVTIIGDHIFLNWSDGGFVEKEKQKEKKRIEDMRLKEFMAKNEKIFKIKKPKDKMKQREIAVLQQRLVDEYIEIQNKKGEK